ncbi:MAG: hypothetical protein HC778_09160 [Chamaesiphon sp. CSU_1_12]|nr:hypothetical protein [Chamaesiphon sp. CSU_1_12]
MMEVTPAIGLQLGHHLGIITEDLSIVGIASMKSNRSAYFYIAQNLDRICHRSTLNYFQSRFWRCSVAILLHILITKPPRKCDRDRIHSSI